MTGLLYGGMGGTQMERDDVGSWDALRAAQSRQKRVYEAEGTQGFCLPRPRNPRTEYGSTIRASGSSSTKKAPCRTQPLWCARDRSARCRDSQARSRHGGLRAHRKRLSAGTRPLPALPGRHPIQRLLLQPAVPAVQPHHHLVPFRPSPPCHHSSQRLQPLTAGGEGPPAAAPRQPAAARHGAAAARPPRWASAPAGGASGRAARRGLRVRAAGVADLRGRFSVSRPCTPSLRLALLSFLLEESGSARVVISATDFHPGSEEKQALARGWLLKLRNYISTSLGIIRKGWKLRLSCLLVTVKNYCLPAVWTIPLPDLAQFPCSQCKSRGNFTGCRIKHEYRGADVAFFLQICTHSDSEQSENLCKCEAVRHTVASFMLFQELSCVASQNHMPQSIYSCDLTARVFLIGVLRCLFMYWATVGPNISSAL